MEATLKTYWCYVYEVTVIRDLFILLFGKWCLNYRDENIVKCSVMKNHFSTTVGVNKALELINSG